MNRDVCGTCWCPYDEDTGECACPPPNVQGLVKAAQQAFEALLLTHNLAKEHYDTKWSAIIALRDALAAIQNPTSRPAQGTASEIGKK